MDWLFTLDKSQRKYGSQVKVSLGTHKKIVQLQKFKNYADANHVWGKDEKLLKYNILNVPNQINYAVIMAMGRNRKAD